MTAQIHQIASGIYDQMSMWNFDQYPGAQKDDKSFIRNDVKPFPMFPHLNGGPSRDSPCPSKKKPQPVPEEQKDESYRERRRRNNEAARKSREQRRYKEDQTCKQLGAIQQENFRLRHEVQRLHSEIQDLRYMLAAVNNMATMNMNQNGPNWTGTP